MAETVDDAEWIDDAGEDMAVSAPFPDGGSAGEAERRPPPEPAGAKAVAGGPTGTVRIVSTKAWMSKLRCRNDGRAEMKGSGRANRSGGGCEAAVVAVAIPSCLGADACADAPGKELKVGAVAVAVGTGLPKGDDVYDPAASGAGPSSGGVKKAGKKLLMSAVAC